MKILKELRKAINRNAETYKRKLLIQKGAKKNQKIHLLKAEVKAMNSSMNNTKE